MHEMPVRWEPVLAIVRSANPQELHDYWQKNCRPLARTPSSRKDQRLLHARLRFVFHQIGWRQIGDS